MKTFVQRFEELRDACVTVDDWRKAYDELFYEARELNDESLRMQGAIVDKYGEKALDEIVEMALDDDFSPDVTPATKEMVEYGYGNMNILPLNKETASVFFEKECAVYMLFPNNSEKRVTSIEELNAFDGLFGVSIPEITEKIASEAGFSVEQDFETVK